MMLGDQSKISTQALKQQHEKSIEEASPSKHLKVINIKNLNSNNKL